MNTPPTIVLLTVDSLRADHVYNDLAETPNIDELVTDGVAVESAFAQGPFTTFSMPSLFTSRYPIQLTGIDFVEGVEGVLVEGVPTVQECLSEAGYRTAGIHSNPLLSRLFGFDRGFHHFYDSLDSVSLLGSERLGLILSKIKRLLRTDAYASADEITNRACRWLDRTDENERFLWAHYMDVHGPYQSKQGLGALNKVQAERLWRNVVHNPSEVTASERKTLRETYVEEVEFTDREIGRLIQYLRDDGLYGEALVILTADHGDEFFEHGSYSHENKLYEELIRVPLVVKLPDSLDPIGEAVEQSLIPLLDIAPTLCDAAGAETEGFEGQSLFCSATDRTQQSCDRDDRLISEAIVSEAQALPEYIGAVRTPTWKYIRTRNETDLYNLSEDSDETTDVSGTELQVVERLGSHLDAHIELRATADEKGSVHDGTTVDDRLRSLGYLE